MEFEEVTTQLPPLLFKKIEHAVRHFGRPEVIERDNEGYGNLASRDACVADHGIDAVGIALVQLCDGACAPLLRGEVRIDVAVFEVDVDHLVASAAQNLGSLRSDAARSSGDDVNTH